MKYVLPEWMNEAACVGIDVDVFFPELFSTYRTDELHPVELAPKHLCFTCPVQEECLDYMYANETEQGVQEGVWGGTLLRERRSVAHLPPCKGNSPAPCRGCRPVEERISMLLDLVEQQARFLSQRCNLNETRQLALL